MRIRDAYAAKGDVKATSILDERIKNLQGVSTERESNQPVSYVDDKGNVVWGTMREARGRPAAAYSPTVKGAISEATVTGKGRGENILLPEKDRIAASRLLKTAGYDTETGIDKVTELIKKSTGGRIPAAGAEVASWVNIATEGRKAINTLEAMSNKMTMDLMGGKLGAGISNADREFIIGQLGNVSNPNKTTDERLAAWEGVKERMINVGLIVPTTGGKPPLSSFSR
jgi:hypothetical protein